MSHVVKKRRAKRLVGRILTVALAASLALQGLGAHMLLKAAKIDSSGWAVITDVGKKLEAPMLVTMMAAVPLGIIGGGVLMAIGHRHAARILGQVIAGVVVVGLAPALTN